MSECNAFFVTMLTASIASRSAMMSETMDSLTVAVTPVVLLPLECMVNVPPIHEMVRPA